MTRQPFVVSGILVLLELALFFFNAAALRHIVQYLESGTGTSSSAFVWLIAMFVSPCLALLCCFQAPPSSRHRRRSAAGAPHATPRAKPRRACARACSALQLSNVTIAFVRHYSFFVCMETGMNVRPAPCWRAHARAGTPPTHPRTAAPAPWPPCRSKPAC